MTRQPEIVDSSGRQVEVLWVVGEGRTTIADVDKNYPLMRFLFFINIIYFFGFLCSNSTNINESSHLSF